MSTDTASGAVMLHLHDGDVAAEEEEEEERRKRRRSASRSCCGEAGPWNLERTRRAAAASAKDAQRDHVTPEDNLPM
ncbi:unnamed protein product [Pleuronectes platessa]|uniref:Uncharacterized protein n=1 Tax=Pleuronectes platessa TaxID=8262 RepID=A0A9N7ZC97_PLEPL|nr:unnamed protein product [Pleuronectes platessa]